MSEAFATPDFIRNLGKRALQRTPYTVMGDTRYCTWCEFQSFTVDLDRDSHTIDCIWVQAHVLWQQEAKDQGEGDVDMPELS